jgi:23S rRNA (pseudouridine1915-N3)-methyltransferase
VRIKLICVGKTGKSFLEEGENHYLARLKHYVHFERIEIPDIKQVKNLSEEQIKVREGEQILSKIGLNERLFLLDENGQTFSSEKFADFLQKEFNKGGQSIIFVIGGPYGFSDEVKARAAGKVSLSAMTFSHQMVRMFFIEQVYRAMTIQRGEPYHHR